MARYILILSFLLASCASVDTQVDDNQELPELPPFNIESL